MKVQKNRIVSPKLRANRAGSGMRPHGASRFCSIDCWPFFRCCSATKAAYGVAMWASLFKARFTLKRSWSCSTGL